MRMRGGGPRDGDHLAGQGEMPSEARFASPDPAWEHAYVLRGTEQTGFSYEYAGLRLVAPRNEEVQCPECGRKLPWRAPPETATEEGAVRQHAKVCRLMAMVYEAEGKIARGEVPSPGPHLRPDPDKTAEMFRSLAKEFWWFESVLERISGYLTMDPTPNDAMIAAEAEVVLALRQLRELAE